MFFTKLFAKFWKFIFDMVWKDADIWYITESNEHQNCLSIEFGY